MADLAGLGPGDLAAALAARLKPGGHDRSWWMVQRQELPVIVAALESAAADRETIRIAADALAHGFVDLASRALRAALESRP